MGVSTSWQEHTTPDSWPHGALSLPPGGLWATHAEAELNSTSLRVTCSGEAQRTIIKEKCKCQYQLVLDNILEIIWLMHAFGASRSSELIRKLGLRSKVWDAMRQRRVYRCVHSKSFPFPRLCPSTLHRYLAFVSKTDAITGALDAPQPSFCILPPFLVQIPQNSPIKIKEQSVHHWLWAKWAYHGIKNLT